MQGTLDLPKESLTLPEMILGPIKYPIGHAWVRLRPEETAEIDTITNESISPRVMEKCFHLSNGEKIVITNRTKLDLPNGIDGALTKHADGKLEWLNHMVLREANSRLDRDGLKAFSVDTVASWKNQFRFRAESKTVKSPQDYGLRPPQLGALFAVGSHWSLNDSHATIVMPTGTGKTETMLASVTAYQVRTALVAVPSKALRWQTADKFLRLGLLQELGVLPPEARTPVVGVVSRRPKTEQDLQIFDDCNVIVGTVPSLSGGTAANFLIQIATKCDLLIVDEAHHVSATTWSALRDAFKGKRILQFTATPFRADGKLVDGTVIYSYPLHAAQRDDYFKQIEFVPIHELDESLADNTIASVAVERLRSDIGNGFDHLLLARCQTTARAEEVFQVYAEIAKDLNPILIHSDIEKVDERIEALRSGNSKIAVCVNMLGEGVDIPQLKVAAIHDKHQSLAVLLQFVGRFARRGGSNIGDASVVANIANPKISAALEELYGEDSDWNVLLSEMSSTAARGHAELIAFLENSKELGEEFDEGQPGISRQSLRPVFSTLFYNADEFFPKNFHKGLPDKQALVRVWLNEETNTLFFVTRSSERVKWTRSKEVEEIEWNLFVLHFDSANKVLYLASTSKASNFEIMARAVGANEQISGEIIFKSLGNIGRLVFNNLGVTKPGRRNLSYAMYTGADVKTALSETEKQGSRKSNISGHGWENGRQITIGCSYKGRVWSKAAGTLPEFIKWAEGVGAKLKDPNIDTKKIIENVLIPEFANELPECEILGMEWPAEILGQSEERVTIKTKTGEHHLFLLEVRHLSCDRAKKEIEFEILAESESDSLAQYRLSISGEAGFKITCISGSDLELSIGGREGGLLADFLNYYPPLVRFVDLSELDGNVILRSENPLDAKFPEERLEAWDWSGVDIKKESIWKDGSNRTDSIQWHVAQKYVDEGYTVVFDDDGAGEAADLICMKLENDHIKLSLIHCKFSGSADAGRRVKDAVEVASQAVRSARWPGHFKKLIRHLENRLKARRTNPTRNLFLAGSTADLGALLKASRFYEVRPEVIIVQPGISRSKMTDDQSAVLGAAAAYLKQTLGVDLDIICSD